VAHEFEPVFKKLQVLNLKYVVQSSFWVLSPSIVSELDKTFGQNMVGGKAMSSIGVSVGRKAEKSCMRVQILP
jgi:hypothetical protein